MTFDILHSIWNASGQKLNQFFAMITDYRRLSMVSDLIRVTYCTVIPSTLLYSIRPAQTRIKVRVVHVSGIANETAVSKRD